LRCYGHESSRDENDLVECVDYNVVDVKTVRLRRRSKKTWREVVKKTLGPVNYVKKMLWTVVNGEN